MVTIGWVWVGSHRGGLSAVEWQLRGVVRSPTLNIFRQRRMAALWDSKVPIIKHIQAEVVLLMVTVVLELQI